MTSLKLSVGFGKGVDFVCGEKDERERKRARYKICQQSKG